MICKEKTSNEFVICNKDESRKKLAYKNVRTLKRTTIICNPLKFYHSNNVIRTRLHLNGECFSISLSSRQEKYNDNANLSHDTCDHLNYILDDFSNLNSTRPARRKGLQHRLPSWPGTAVAPPVLQPP